jgi:hypothetical protein
LNWWFLVDGITQEQYSEGIHLIKYCGWTIS